MDDDTQRQAKAILGAIRESRRALIGFGPAAKRAAAAHLPLLAYTRDGMLAPHVRDVCSAKGVQAVESALGTLEDLAREFAQPEKKLRQDANEIAHRVMLEATGQAPKTPPPGDRSEDEKNPEAVARGAKGGRPPAPDQSQGS